MKLDLNDELRNIMTINKEKNISYKLLLTEENYDAYYVQNDSYKGVGIVIDEKFKNFVYYFENIVIKVEERTIEGNNKKYLIELLSDKINDTDEFIFICTKFIEAGNNGYNRKQILNNPQDWVDKWKNIFGNKSSEDRVYPLLGELISLKHLLKSGKNASLTSQGSHDIETNDCNYEVKTTTMRYESLVEIHSKNQLASLNGNPLFLYFVRLEESVAGVSLMSIIKDLNDLGYNIDELREKTSYYNSQTLNKCFKIDEVRIYKIDNEFPKIVDSSFVDGQLPKGIYSLKYTIDLSNLAFENVELNDL